ncbi:MAG: HEAT repeat domain-containing protein, partial [Desulfobulbaceae bacterium]|nr:HEAT repeat domain-containing protein [Desulfobulbaceae bacterium]
MLANCMETAVGEARKRLDDVAPEKIRLLLELICRLGGEEAVAVLRELLDHPNRLVAKEVFAALLARRDHWAMDSLRQFLGADDWESKRGAIHLAGQCRLREFVPELVAMLEPPGLFRTNLRKNVPLIKALGQIGDPAALPALEKIVRRSFSLFPKDLRQLKKTVFESIGHYPAASLATLIAMGEKAQDKTIRVACQRVALHSLRQT